jgi:hypothetical protein
MLSRLANLAGLYIGDESDMLPATEHNQAGYWEPGWLCDLNDRMMVELGGTWHAPPRMEAGWNLRPEIETFRSEAAQALKQRYEDQSLWGWKDPRTTLLLPFWRELLDTPKFVVCIRNPLDVAASLSSRDKIRVSHAVALWHYYTEMALRQTKPDERRVVFYESFFEDYRAALGPILEFVGLEMPAESSPQDVQMRQFVNRDLKHHSHTAEDILHHPDIPDFTKAFFEGLLKARATQGPVHDGSAVPLSSEKQWQKLVDLVDKEGRRYLSWESCELRKDAWEKRRLDAILNSMASALTVSAGRWLRRMPPLYRIARRHVPDRAVKRAQQV